MNNEVRFNEYRKKKILKVLVIVLSVVIIVLECLALFKVIHYIWGLVVFGLVYLLRKFFLKENK